MKLKVEGQNLKLSERQELVSGSVDVYNVQFVFDESWDGYAKTAVFLAGDKQIEMVTENDCCVIPWEVLTEDGAFLKIGVYGVKEGKRLPTLWVNAGTVFGGAKSGDKHSEPTADVYEQILTMYEETKEIAQNIGSELVDEMAKKVDTELFNTELEGKLDKDSLGEKTLLITYEDDTTETIKLAVYND